MRDDIRALLSWEEVEAAPGCPSWPPRLRPEPFVFSLAVGLKPLPSLNGGLDELLEVRLICSSSWATRADNVSICEISCVTRTLTAGGVASQSRSAMPAGGRPISACLALRSTPLWRRCQGRQGPEDLDPRERLHLVALGRSKILHDIAWISISQIKQTVSK